MTRLGALVLALGLASLHVPACHAEEKFDVSAYEKKAFEWKGFVEARPERQWLRRDSAGYRLQYAGESRGSADRFSAAAEVSGTLRHEQLSFNFTGHAGWVDDPRGADFDSRTYEAYGGWQIDAGTRVELGKRALRWGKGYAWNPVAFLERPKDPTDPELAREGFTMATAAWVGSYEGPVKSLSLTGAIVPSSRNLNADFGVPSTGRHANAALKLYGLVLDTDVDLVWAARGSHGPRVGFDFSRNLGSNLEVHGEWARSEEVPRTLLAAGDTLASERRTVHSALVGLRYLTERDTTLIAELYRTSGGYTSDELSAFYELARASAGDAALGQLAMRAAAQGYIRPNAAQRYVYLRVSQKEPFDILDFTPSLTVVANAGDRSWSAIPELLYTGTKNVELRLRWATNHGGRSTEYGERAVRSRVELRARVFF